MIQAAGDDPELAIEARFGGRDGGPTGNGARLGPYKLLEILGEGGMGVVWRAEQAHPVRREVALKIIKLGMDTEQVTARFESERQALAVLAHPNIAQVFDAGATDDGRPYFAMELVSGSSITEYCDERRMTAGERIELFLLVCQGVQHAHLKGIVHRDLKPSNVLVTDHGANRVPKIIDFGIAKAMGEKLAERTLVTRMGHVLGTPAYMSPEQADPDNRDVDTRSDVYSLGVMLYELLVGALPAEPETIAALLARNSLGELVIPRPSARLTGLGDTREEIAHARGTTLESLGRTLAGDLDWIILKAMEKERLRRYPSVEALANDLRRYLAHEPVEARPPSTTYRLHKFARRHRAGVVAVSAIAMALVLGAGSAMYGMFRARVAEAEARHDAETARRIKDFMIGIFRQSRPYVTSGEEVTARQLLDRGRDQLAHELEGQPLLEAEFMGAMGNAYKELGLYDQAAPLLESAYEERRQQLAENDPDVADALQDLGQLRSFQARWDEALELLTRALVIREERLGPSHEAVSDTLSALSTVHARLAHYDRAREMEHRSLSIRRAGSSERRIAESLHQLGVIATFEDRYTEALDWYEQTLELVSGTAGEEDPFTQDVRAAIALCLQVTGRPEEALEIQRSVLESRERVFGPDHQIVGLSLHNLGRALGAVGRHTESIPYLERSIRIRERVLGSNHPSVGHSLETLAIASAVTGDLDSADRYFTRTRQIYEESLGESHPETLETLFNLGILAQYQGSMETALERLELAVERGHRDLETLLAPPLDALVGKPRYDALVQTLTQEAARPGNPAPR